MPTHLHMFALLVTLLTPGTHTQKCTDARAHARLHAAGQADAHTHGQTHTHARTHTVQHCKKAIPLQQQFMNPRLGGLAVGREEESHCRSRFVRKARADLPLPLTFTKAYAFRSVGSSEADSVEQGLQ